MAGLLLFCQCATGAHAADWTLATSAHFEVYTTAGGKRAREALDYLEQVDAFFVRYLALAPTPRPRVRVIVFSNDAEYAPYRPAESATAFFQSAYDRDFIVLRDINADSMPVVIHEYAHLALSQTGAHFPLWLGEGLAEFFSTLSPDGKRTLIGRPALNRLETLRTAPVMPASRLWTVTHESPEYIASPSADQFYAASWALTHMILLNDRYRAGSDRFVALVAGGTPSPQAFASVYGKTPALLDRDLDQYVTRAFYGFRFVDVPSTTTTAPSASEAITAFDAGLVLAELLAAQRGHESQARSAFAALAQQQPAHAGLLEAWAFFERRTDHSDAAEALFQKAADGGSHTALVYSAYFKARRMLAQARPVDALSLLESLGPIPDSIAFEFYQVLANAHFVRGDLQEAADAAARVVQNARASSEVTFAEKFVKEVGGPPDMSRIATGRLRNMACDGALPVLHVETPTGTLRLVIDDPGKVLVAGGEMTTDLSCGAQDRPVKIGYSVVNPPTGTTGRVRFLDFR